MKILLSFFILFFVSKFVVSQTVDSLIDVGGYKLHFHIINGKGTPILFEAGGGEDATTWKNILKPIADITGTTLISYDRAGFGQSTFDTSKHGILNGIKGLKTGLQKLGFNGNMILVAHSQGGLYATLYASRHSNKIKAAILVDVTTSCFYEKNRLAATQQLINVQNNDSLKKANPGIYYQGSDFSDNINAIRNIDFPKSIPVIDFVSDYPPFPDKKDTADWKKCHKEFVNMAPNRRGIIAYGCGHFIFEDNPALVIDAIVKTYVETNDKTNSDKVLIRALDYSINAANNRNKEEIAYRHSEDDLNSWGYTLLQQGDLQKVLEVFKLNVELYPDSWNVYDSYGYALLKNGQKEEAIKMYKKSIELNPKNENGKNILQEISK